ncbi:MAG: S8 family peptidase [Alphaproteobacteria bacterium]
MDAPELVAAALTGDRGALLSGLFRLGYLTAETKRHARTKSATTGGSSGMGIAIAGIGLAGGGGAVFAVSQGGQAKSASSSAASGTHSSAETIDIPAIPVVSDDVGEGVDSRDSTASNSGGANEASTCENDPLAPSCFHDDAIDYNANPRNIQVGAQSGLIDRESIRSSDEYTGAGLQTVLPGYNATPFTLAVGADYALANGWTGKGVKIGIFDDPIDPNHTEFASFEHGGGMEHCDNCGYYFSHGTHVAGIAAADYGDGGMTGIAPDATVYAVSIFDEYGSFTPSLDQLSAMVADAVADDVRVFNNSWGGALYDPSALYQTAAAFDQAQDEGAVFVWARGNAASYDTEGNDFARLPVYFPELEENWVAVTNVVESQPGNGDWVISNGTAGTTIDGQGYHANANECGDAANWCIAAPGTLIFSAARDGSPVNAWEYAEDANGDNYAAFSGTSMAAPVVSGAFAVLFQAFPYLETDVLVDLVFATATDLGEEGVDEVYGHGMLNLEEAMTFQGAIPVIATTSNVSGGGANATQSGISTNSTAVSKQFEEAIEGVIVLDAYDRAFRLNPSLLTNVGTTQTEYGTLQSRSNNTLGHFNFANRELTVGNSPALSAHFREISQGLFFSARLGQSVVATVGVGLDEQYAASVAIGDERLSIEAGAILDRKEGRMPMVETAGAFATGTSAATAYVRAETKQPLGTAWALSLAGEVGVTRSMGQAEQSLTVGNPIATTVALEAGLQRNIGNGFIKGTIALPVSVVQGEVVYLLPTDREVNGEVVQEERTWNLNNWARPTVGLVYDWGNGSVGAETDLAFENMNAFFSYRF